MKITAVECFPVYNGSRNNLFVVVDTDEGISGVGESGLTGRELAVMGAIEHFKPLLIGQDAGRIEHLWQMLFRGGFFPAHRVHRAAPSRRSTSRCGTSRARRWACRSTSCWAGACATKWCAIRITQAPGEATTSRRWSRTARSTSTKAGSSCAGGCRRMATCSSRAGGQDGAQAVRGGARRRSATRSSCAWTSIPGWSCPTPSGYVERASSSGRSSWRTRCAPRTRICTSALRQQTAVPLAAGEQFASKWEFREMIEEDLIDYCAGRPVHRRRDHRGAQDRRLVRDARHPAGHAQPARAGLDAACCS